LNKTNFYFIYRSVFEYSLDEAFDASTNKCPITYYVPGTCIIFYSFSILWFFCLFSYNLNIYCKGHLQKRSNENRKQTKNISITYVTFSPNGDELLVNYGGEQLYLFDLILGANMVPTRQFKYDSYKQMLNEFEQTINIDTDASNTQKEASITQESTNDTIGSALKQNK
jgi:hypothetical protein